MNKWWKLSYIEIFLFIIIVVIYFVLRIPHLTQMPIFADEAIYIRWAQVMKSVATLRFLPLTDGKTPLFMWVLIPIFKLFHDPLFAGRILSVISGFFTLIGIIFLGLKFFNKRIAILSALLIAITPFTLFFDRMALVDSMLTAFSVWSLNLSLLLIEYPRIDLAMFLGYVLGGGLLTKPPGFFSAISLPATLATFNWSVKDRQSRMLKLFSLWILALVIMYAIYNILRLGPGFSNLTSRNEDYVFSPYDLRGRIFDPFIPHLHDLMDWFPKLLSWPMTVAAVVGMLWVLIKRDLRGVAVLLWLLVPLTIQMFFLKTFTARYILTSIPPLLVLGAIFLDRLIVWSKSKKIITTTILVIVIMLASLRIDYLLITNPAQANLPRSERRGYLEDWTAGYGLKDIASFLDDQSKNGLVIVGTEGSFGTLPDGLQIYLDQNRQVVIIGGTASVSAQIRDSARQHPTYFVTNRVEVGDLEGLKLIKSYPKVIGPDFPQFAIELYQVTPSIKGR